MTMIWKQIALLKSGVLHTIVCTVDIKITYMISNCPLVREKAMYFQCSFCGDIGHPSDNCAARLQALQEQQRGYLCSYCGAVDHMSENCSKLRENIAREKADINRRNIEKYEASKQHTAKGQENIYQTEQGKTEQ